MATSVDGTAASTMGTTFVAVGPVRIAREPTLRR
jgi:hypothetical protein